MSALTFADNGQPATVGGAMGRLDLGLRVLVNGPESAVRAFCAQAQAARDAGRIVLTMNLAEARELRECIDADVMDLSTVALDPEDQAKVDTLSEVLRRLDALLKAAS